MKTEKNILDEFGKELVSQVYDRALKSLEQYSLEEVKNTNVPKVQNFKSFFASLDEKQKRELFNYQKDLLFGVLFSFLEIVEDRDYKLVYEVGEQRVYLDKASFNVNTGMLKAEPMGEEGWIARFSQYADKVPDDVLPRDKKE